jgi:putative transposase
MTRRGYNISDQYGIYFLTFTVVGWADVFTRPQCRQIILDSFAYCKKHKGLILYGYVIMSNHIHLIAQTKPESKGMSAFIRDFKKHTANELIDWFQKSKKESRRKWMIPLFNAYGVENSNNKYFQVWKNDSMPKLVLTSKVAKQKLDYIHMNPVKAGIVDSPEEYLYSSARNYAGRKDYVIEVELLEMIYTL